MHTTLQYFLCALITHISFTSHAQWVKTDIRSTILHSPDFASATSIFLRQDSVGVILGFRDRNLGNLPDSSTLLFMNKSTGQEGKLFGLPYTDPIHQDYNGWMVLENGYLNSKARACYGCSYTKSLEYYDENFNLIWEIPLFSGLIKGHNQLNDSVPLILSGNDYVYKLYHNGTFDTLFSFDTLTSIVQNQLGAEYRLREFRIYEDKLLGTATNWEFLDSSSLSSYPVYYLYQWDIYNKTLDTLFYIDSRRLLDYNQFGIFFLDWKLDADSSLGYYIEEWKSLDSLVHTYHLPQPYIYNYSRIETFSSNVKVHNNDDGHLCILVHENSISHTVDSSKVRVHVFDKWHNKLSETAVRDPFGGKFLHLGLSTFDDDDAVYFTASVTAYGPFVFKIDGSGKVSVQEITPKSSLLPYPNPFKNSIAISGLQAEKTYSYQLFDFNGRWVQKGNLNAMQASFVTEQLPSGCYILQLNDSAQKEPLRFKVVKTD